MGSTFNALFDFFKRWFRVGGKTTQADEIDFIDYQIAEYEAWSLGKSSALDRFYTEGITNLVSNKGNQITLVELKTQVESYFWFHNKKDKLLGHHFPLARAISMNSSSKLMNISIETNLKKDEKEEIDEQKELDDILKENNIKILLTRATFNSSAFGYSVAKLRRDDTISENVIIEIVPATNTQLIFKSGRLIEVEFTECKKDKFIFKQIYGLGYITHHLFKDEKEVPLTNIDDESINTLEDEIFDNKIMLASVLYNNANIDSDYSAIIDVLQDIDQVYTKLSGEVRTSGNITYIPQIFLDTSANDDGSTSVVKPSEFKNNYIVTSEVMAQEGSNAKIDYHKREFNNSGYADEFDRLIRFALIGTGVSPASFGLANVGANASGERVAEDKTFTDENFPIRKQLYVDFVQDLYTKVWNFDAILEGKEIEEITITVPRDKLSQEDVITLLNSNLLTVKEAIQELFPDISEEDLVKRLANIESQFGIVTDSTDISANVANLGEETEDGEEEN